jgi:hypothetical protein
MLPRGAFISAVLSMAIAGRSHAQPAPDPAPGAQAASAAGASTTDAQTPAAQKTIVCEGQVYFRLFSYARYLNQRNIAASYTDFFGIEHALQQRQEHPAGEVLRAVQRMVLNAEVPVLPLRLVVECVARGSSTGRRRRQSELHGQSLHLGRCRHHLADEGPQHGSPDFPI